jgi:hypothetical protein
MVDIRLVLPNKNEFDRKYYKPGVISLSRIIWGSIGGGLLLLIIGLFSESLGIGVLYPPLAATCFINATCVFLRVARPKSVIVGHFIATVGGLLGVYVGELFFQKTHLFLAMKLGLAVFFASIFMQILDADHPPAAATAAIPALFPIIPPPSDNLVLPLHMAWGAVIAVIFAFIWNRIWFDWPVDDQVTSKAWLNLQMDNFDFLGTIICVVAFVLMCFLPFIELIYNIGLLTMLIGVIILSLHHFPKVKLIIKS